MPPFRDRLLRSAAARYPITASLACLGLLGALLVLTGGRHGALELLVTAGAVLTAYVSGSVPVRAAALVALTAYLGVEAAADELDYERYWEHVLALALVAGAVLAAGRDRAWRSEARREAEAAAARSRALSARDDLRRLLRARSLDDIDRELVRSRRHAHHVSILLVRPDGIDDIRTLHGAAAATELLRVTAQTIGENLRGTDLAASEDDAFHVLLPETPSGGARVAAERIRLALSLQRLVLDGAAPIDLSVSVGIASFPDDGAQRDELLSRAAAALARAVELGGNRTVLHSVRSDAPPRWGLAGTPGSAAADL